MKRNVKRLLSSSGRLILTDYSLYFEPAAVMMPYCAIQKWDLAADLQQIVEPCAVGPWNLPLFDRAISCKSVSKCVLSTSSYHSIIDLSVHDNVFSSITIGWLFHQL